MAKKELEAPKSSEVDEQKQPTTTSFDWWECLAPSVQAWHNLCNYNNLKPTKKGGETQAI